MCTSISSSDIYFVSNIMYLFCKQYINLLHLHEQKVYFLVLNRCLQILIFHKYTMVVSVFKLFHVVDGGVILFREIPSD